MSNLPYDINDERWDRGGPTPISETAGTITGRCLLPGLHFNPEECVFLKKLVAGYIVGPAGRKVIEKLRDFNGA